MVESRLTAWTRPHRAFAIITLVFGTALVLLIPPFQSQDEVPHFQRAYQISEGTFIANEKDPDGLGGGYLPASLGKIISPFTKMFFRPNVKASVDDIRAALRIPLDPRIRIFYAFANTAHYAPVCYSASAFGIAAGRALGFTPLALLYFGREANLIGWIALGFFALRASPAIARPLMVLLLMPMPLYLAASVSADPTTIGLAALFTAIICKCVRRSIPIDAKTWISLATVSILLSLSKYAYLPMLGLILLIPSRRFRGRGRFVTQFALLAALNLITLSIWVHAAAAGLNTRVKPPGDASPPLQLQWLQQNTGQIPRLIVNTFRIDGWLFVQSYVGVIGSFDRPLPSAVIISYLILLLAACWTADPEPALPTVSRAAIVILPIVAISCLIIATLDYLYWSPPGLFFIDGLNGRYLIPLTPPVLLLLCAIGRRFRPRVVRRWGENPMNLAAALMCVALSIYFLSAVCTRYYG
jgi:uncharacterized membrane protein